MNHFNVVHEDYDTDDELMNCSRCATWWWWWQHPHGIYLGENESRVEGNPSIDSEVGVRDMLGNMQSLPLFFK